MDKKNETTNQMNKTNNWQQQQQKIMARVHWSKSRRCRSGFRIQDICSRFSYDEKNLIISINEIWRHFRKMIIIIIGRANDTRTRQRMRNKTPQKHTIGKQKCFQPLTEFQWICYAHIAQIKESLRIIECFITFHNE